MNLFNNCFKGKRVLVTGHTGFKGSWISIWLSEMGADVVGYALLPYTDRDNFVLSGLTNRIVDIHGDVRDYDKLKSVFDKYKPEIVFHLAAQPLVRLSYEIPKDTYDVNVGGTVNVLECIRNSDSPKSAVIVTSDKCYENKEWVWGYRENDPLGGYDPYSSSKGACEIVISGYINSYFNPLKFHEHGKLVASARAGNVIGGGDWSKDRIIPDCIRALEGGETIKVRNPVATRPWQHVIEPIYGYLLLAFKLFYGETLFSGAWNFGPNYDSVLNVENIVKNLIKYWGEGNWEDVSSKTALHEAKLLTLDCSKAREILKWNPTLDIYEALEFTANWYKNCKDTDVYSLCVGQINEYVKKLSEKVS